MAEDAGQNGVLQVAALGLAQTIAWASSTYLPAVLSGPMAREFGVPSSMVFAAYSLALVAMAAAGPAVGRAIDARGGRGVLCLSNGVLAAGLCLLGLSTGMTMLFAGWVVIGVGMALGLYDAAFAALVRLHGANAGRSITGITLLGGFASTIGWPLTAAVAAAWDWRAACFLWAAGHILIALPLNAFAIPDRSGTGRSPGFPAEAPTPADGAQGRRIFPLLAVFGAATAFVTSAMAAHLPAFLQAMGVAAGAALAASALVGVAQVAARLSEFIAGRYFRFHALATARVACALHPVGGLLLLGAGGVPWAAGFFGGLHGAGNGLITIAKGTLPLALFGSMGYGARLGRLAVAQRVMQAAAPFLFALVLEHSGGEVALSLAIGLSAIAFFALLGIRVPANNPSREG